MTENRWSADSIVPVILAAGQGRRMKSRLPKALQPLLGQSMLAHVLACLHQVGLDHSVVVVGHGAEAIRKAFTDQAITFIDQQEQLGTGHALAQALPHLSENSLVLVLYADVPLIRPATLSRLIRLARQGGVAWLTAYTKDCSGMGRIIRDRQGHVSSIVEESDCSPEQLGIREVNTGILVAPNSDLSRWVKQLNNLNTQGEYYLTDCMRMAVAEECLIRAHVCGDSNEVIGINDRRQLAKAEKVLNRRRIDLLLEQGVTFRDPDRVYVRGQIQVGRDVTIDVDVLLEGDVTLQDNCFIGPFTCIRNTKINKGAHIESHCVIEGAEVGENSIIGPFARLRPGTTLKSQVRVGNFVEIKNSFINNGSKINHLSYIGDANLGPKVNIGAGTITCNYDGTNKHQTHIGKGAFIGSNTALIAPVSIGKQATIGAGSVIVCDAPDGQLTLSRPEQKTISSWKRPLHKE